MRALEGWTSEQKHVVAASFLGWALDAFDFFLLVFLLKDIAQEFHTQITEVTFAILLTLAMRPVGAYLFGRLALGGGAPKQAVDGPNGCRYSARKWPDIPIRLGQQLLHFVRDRNCDVRDRGETRPLWFLPVSPCLASALKAL